LTNITTRNVVSISNSTPVACNICDIASGTNVYIDNIYARTSGQSVFVSDMVNMQIGNAPNVSVLNGSVNATANTFAPAFLATANVQSNVTGDGPAASVNFVNEIFDTNSNYNDTTGLFTAPCQGRYSFNVTIALAGLTSSHTTGEIKLTTSNRDYIIGYGNFYAMSTSGELTINGAVLADMDSGDTAYVIVTVSGGAKDVDIENITSKFAGNLYK
jgi:hypothetical protein